MILIQYLNACIDPCNAVVCCVAMFYLVMKRGKENPPSRLLYCLLIMGFLLNIAETFAFYYNGSASEIGYTMVRVSNFIAFANLFILISMETVYFRSRVKELGGTISRKLSGAGLLLCVVGLLALILSASYGFFYSFDAQNRYEASDYIWGYLVMVGLALLVLLLQVILSRGMFREREYKAFLSLSLIPLGILFIQYMIPDLYLLGFAFTVPVLSIAFAYLRDAAETSMFGENLKLTNENIFYVFQELEGFMKYFDMEQRTRFKARMTIEEILLRMQERFGEEEDFDIFAFVRFRRPQIRIEKKGALFNPLRKEAIDWENWSGGMLVSLGMSPVFSYVGGKNILKLQLERQQINPALQMLITLAIGIVSGYMALGTLSATDQTFLNEDVLTPVYGMMSNLLYCVTGPILFVMVIAVILDTAGISEQGGSSVSLVFRYFVLSCAAGLVTLFIVFAALRMDMGGTDFGKEEIKTLLGGILSVVPRDVFTPFVEANTPQLILISILLGMAIVALGARTKELNIWIRQANLVSMQLARWISGIMPYFAIFMAAWIVLNGYEMELAALIPLLIGSVLITLLCMAAYTWYVCILEKVRPGVLLKKCMPSFMNSLKSGSLDTSYALSERCCTSSLGVEKHFVTVSLPLGLVMFMPANVVGTLLFIIYAIIISGVEVSALWMLLSVVLAVILFVATPPIPGANFLAYIVMISVLNIDERALVLALIFEVIYGVFAAPANQFFVQLEMVLQGRRMGLLKEEVLRKAEKKKKNK